MRPPLFFPLYICAIGIYIAINPLVSLRTGKLSFERNKRILPAFYQLFTMPVPSHHILCVIEWYRRKASGSGTAPVPFPMRGNGRVTLSHGIK